MANGFMMVFLTLFGILHPIDISAPRCLRWLSLNLGWIVRLDECKYCKQAMQIQRRSETVSSQTFERICLLAKTVILLIYTGGNGQDSTGDDGGENEKGHSLLPDFGSV